MLLGLIGDAHGRVFHAIAAAITWQVQSGQSFDCLIQVGDLGAFPDVNQIDPATYRHLAADQAEADFSRLLTAQGKRAEIVQALRTQFTTPIYFIRGNHEDFDWLKQLPVDPITGTAAIDPFGFFHYVPDGTVLQFDTLQVAFLGGVEERTDAAAIDRTAYERLLKLEPGAIDLLVTHQGPYGSSVGFRGDIYGSPLISALINRLQPTFHVAGHTHAVAGPLTYGRTTYLCLASLVASPLWQPDARGLQAGCLVVLDTTSSKIWHVTDDWLAQFDTPFDLEAWYEHL